MSDDVKEDIRKHYLSGDGEWLVEKGKVKEARLLKRAYERINQLEKDVRYWSSQFTKAGNDSKEAQKKLMEQDEAIQKGKRRLLNDIEYLKKSAVAIEEKLLS